MSNGFALPIYGEAPPGDLNHLYIAEQKSARIIQLDLTTHQLTTVLDLPDPVVNGDGGLNGFAFSPNFATTGKMYVNISGNAEHTVRILEFTRSTANPVLFDPSSERQIISIPNPNSDHSGGWIDFGPQDGNLYIATGDGGNVGPLALKGLNAQDVNSLQGKLLRINVNGDDFVGDPLRNYAIPANNPFAAGGGAPEVFALGLRHPFRNGFDRDTGNLFIADVGSRFWEEINYLPAGTNGGQNYGWRPREGFADSPDWPDPAPPNAIDPIYVYEHGTAAAVIGGYVYRGNNIPWLEGTYLFGDYVKKTFFSMRYNGQQITEFTDRTTELASPLGSYGGVSSFAENAAGELFLIDYFGGDIYRIVAAPPIEQGDYNQNGVVDAADYTLWRDTLGKNVTVHTGADGNGSGVIDVGDYNLWRSNFGLVLGGAGSGSGSVPEPTAFMLAFVALAGLALRRRHRT